MSDGGRQASASVAVEGLFYEPGTTGGFRLTVPRFRVDPGESVAVIGPSGVGKTTLLNLIAGILKAGDGSIDVGGHRVDRMSDSERRRFRREEIGFVFQEFELLDHLSVRENILLPFDLGRTETSRVERSERVERLASETGIRELLGRKPRRLSQGERQRVALCRALVTDPKLVLADEPTGNLDPANARTALGLLRDQAKRTGATLLVVTHDHSCLDLFDRTFDLGAKNSSEDPVVHGGLDG
ncbi:MAG: ATP-binding cassette domain-containing protein [Planctomycetota bacterium]